MNKERKSISIELKDLDSSKRTAVLAHAVYNNIDRTKDISEKGMFTKSWKENPSVDFLFNHEMKEIPGTALRVFEDSEKAYTEVKFGNWTLGNDILEMADAGVLRGVSFGYYTVKSAPDVVNGQKIRRLKEVKHIETSVLTELPANPLTGVVSLTKSLKEIIELKKLSNEEQNALKSIILSDSNVLMTLVNLSSKLDSSSDLYTWINYNISRRADMLGDLRGQIKYNSEEITQMKSYLINAEKFVKESKASDEAILSIDSEIKKIKDIITEYDTAFTGLATQPDASVNENKSLNEAILLLTTKHF